eukprot:5144861-Ditylum_brightwellii.AAC.1
MHIHYDVETQDLDHDVHGAFANNVLVLLVASGKDDNVDGTADEHEHPPAELGSAERKHEATECGQSLACCV